ncbi:MAG: hypothetical protein LLG20_22615 [Acidobacteriales bacterium]|nr:hypothetical protein [Terriglobales bacterium]
MIQLTPSKPRLVLNLEHIEEPLTLVENATKMAVHNLNESMRRFWEKSDEEIEEMLNHHGLVGIEQIFTAHYTYGSMLNQLLADRGIAEPRVNLTRPRDFTVDQATGRITLVPLPEPPAAPPEPEAEEPAT